MSHLLSMWIPWQEAKHEIHKTRGQKLQSRKCPSWWVATSHLTLTNPLSRQICCLTSPTHLSAFPLKFTQRLWRIQGAQLFLKLCSVSRPLKRGRVFGILAFLWAMGGERKVYTLAEVAEHNDSKDCWLVIEGKVCHVSLCWFKLEKEPSCMGSSVCFDGLCILFSSDLVENVMLLLSSG